MNPTKYQVKDLNYVTLIRSILRKYQSPESPDGMYMCSEKDIAKIVEEISNPIIVDNRDLLNEVQKMIDRPVLEFKFLRKKFITDKIYATEKYQKINS